MHGCTSKRGSFSLYNEVNAVFIYYVFSQYLFSLAENKIQLHLESNRAAKSRLRAFKSFMFKLKKVYLNKSEESVEIKFIYLFFNFYLIVEKYLLFLF